MNVAAAGLTTAIGIGGMTVRLRVPDAAFLRMVEQRYAGFPGQEDAADYEFDVELVAPRSVDDPVLEEDVRVWREGGAWIVTRGDFRAEWDTETRRGRIRQSANPYSMDSVLRIVHTLVLAPQGGFLVHAASAIRNGKAFLFAGVSGAGKTTISRLAPRDATLLTDEISYVRRSSKMGTGSALFASVERAGRVPDSVHAPSDARADMKNLGGLGQSSLSPFSYVAYGTPFAGELAEPGANVQAPLDTLFLLAQGPENRIEPIESPAEAARALLGNILFFAHDPALVQQVFEAALEFVRHVPVKRLTFFPDGRVWELVR